MFGARAGAGQGAASPAARPTLEPTQPNFGRKGTEVNLLILLSSFLASPGLSPGENEVKAEGQHSRDLPHHSIIPQPEALDTPPPTPSHTHTLHTHSLSLSF